MPHYAATDVLRQTTHMAERWVATARGVHLRARAHRNTSPEVALRRAIHARGGRFRLHREIARGCNPDFVFVRCRVAVFVDGDFWHSCPIHGRKTPFTGPNAELWVRKMERNRRRDAEATRLAREHGWRVIRVWECEVKADADAVARRILAAARGEQSA